MTESEFVQAAIVFGTFATVLGIVQLASQVMEYAKIRVRSKSWKKK